MAAAVSRLVYGLNNEDVLGSALQTVHSVVILLDVWYNHPAVGRVAQTWNADRQEKVLHQHQPHPALVIKERQCQKIARILLINSCYFDVAKQSGVAPSQPCDTALRQIV